MSFMKMLEYLSDTDLHKSNLKQSKRVLALVGMVACLLMSWAANAQTITIFTASSMGDALGDLSEAWTNKTKTDVRIVIGPSATLARQISAGAPADIFISANPKWAQLLANNLQYDQNDIVNIASNQLVIAQRGVCKPTSAPSSYTELFKLIGDKQLALANPQTAPAGEYAQKYLQSIGAWDKMEGKLAYGQSAIQTLRLTERAGLPSIVYRTDAKASSLACTQAIIPASINEPITYQAISITKDEHTSAFLIFLLSDNAKATFKRFGFLPISP